jgi:hypothetical protein
MSNVPTDTTNIKKLIEDKFRFEGAAEFSFSLAVNLRVKVKDA